MKKILNITFVMIGMISILSCHHHDDPEPEPTPAHRTLLMYFPYTGSSNNLYSFFCENIDSVESAIAARGGLGDNNLLYFISRSSRESYLISVNYKSNHITRDTLETYSNPDLISSDGISTILTRAKMAAPAENYAMIVGAHGEGWIPGDEAQSSQSKVRRRYFGGTTRNTRTNVTALAEALTKADMHLEFLMFDCCYMSCIENIYDLRDVCDYHIASTSEIMGVGMPYRQIMSSLLQTTPSYSAIVEAFGRFYTDYKDPYGTLAVVRTEYAEQMAQMMSIINQNYSITEEQLSQVQDLDVLHHYTTVYFDLGDYVDKMDIDTYYQQTFHELLAEMVPYKTTTPLIFSSSGRRTMEVKAFSGITISDPTTNSEYIDAKIHTAWWKATH